MDCPCGACTCYPSAHGAAPSLPVQHSALSVAAGLVAATISGALTCFFALVGAFPGAITGAIAGRISNSSVFRGMIFGAVAGSILSIEVLEAARSHWCLEEQGSENSLSMAEFIADLLHARLNQGRPPMGFFPNRWQVDITGLNDDEQDDIGGLNSSQGLSVESLKRLSSHVVTETGSNYGERVCCTICFQDFEVGETLRSLPHCSHKFHLTCVDKWLLNHGSCPMCRRKV